jgi:hypothetical protein
VRLFPFPWCWCHNIPLHVCQQKLCDTGLMITPQHCDNVSHVYSLYSSTGPGAYAPDAPQPIGFIVQPWTPPHGLDVPISAARRLHVHMTREILAAKGRNCGRECWLIILPKCRLPRSI